MPSTYTPIATTTLGSNATSVTFSSISGTYTDLFLVTQTKFTTNSDGFIALRYNSDTASNYSNTYLLGTGSATASGRSSNVTSGRIGNGSSSSSEFSVTNANIQNYSNATTYKTAIARSNATGSYVSSYVSLWRSTSAITSITIVCDGVTFAIGSTFTLYGVKSA